MQNTTTNGAYQPTIKEMNKIPSFEAFSISPDGTKLIFSLYYRNIDTNQIEFFTYFHDLMNQKTSLFLEGQLNNLLWLNNKKFVLLKPTHNGSQVFLYEGLIDDGVQITHFDQEPILIKRFILLHISLMDY